MEKHRDIRTCYFGPTFRKMLVQTCNGKCFHGKLTEGQKKLESGTMDLWNLEVRKLKMKSSHTQQYGTDDVDRNKRCHGIFGISGVDLAAFMPSL